MSSVGPTAAAPTGAIRRPSLAGAVAVAGAVCLALLIAALAAAAATGGGIRSTVRAAVLAALVLAASAVLGATLSAVRRSVADPLRERLLDAAAVAAGLQTVLAALTAFLLYLGTAPATDDPAFGPGLVTFVADVPVGRAWIVAACAAAVLTALLVAVRSRAAGALLWPLAALALVPVAVQGAIGGAPLAPTRAAAGGILVLLLALATWTGIAALRTLRAPVPSRGVALACLVAVAVALGAGAAALRAVGQAPPVAAVALGAALLVVAAVVRGLPALQLVLLAAVTGLGAAATATRALPTVSTRTTPAEILTGAALPSPPTPRDLLLDLQPDPFWLTVCVVLLVGYAVAVRRVAAPWPRGRAAAWTAGALLLAWATSGGPAAYQAVLFGAHLGQHLVVLLLVPALLARGAPARLLAAAAPRVRVPAGRPLAAGAIVVVVVLVAFAGPVLRWSITDPVGAETSLAVALLAGAWLVRSVTASTRRTEALAVVAVLLVLEVLGAVLLGTGSSLVLADWYGAMGWGVDAVSEQRSSALAALPTAMLPTLALLVRALRPRDRATGSGARSTVAG